MTRETVLTPQGLEELKAKIVSGEIKVPTTP